MTEYINHSGGAKGADTYWETEGERYGVKTIAYSFKGHSTYSNNRYILDSEDLYEGLYHVWFANRTLKRETLNRDSKYVQNLLSRNWFQVKNSDTIFAVGNFRGKNNRRQVAGGTGWAVQMGIDNNKSIYVFDQSLESWYVYHPLMGKFIQYYNIPTLTPNFAGIGTRGLAEVGENAIKTIYEYNFKK